MFLFKNKIMEALGLRRIIYCAFSICIEKLNLEETEFKMRPGLSPCLCPRMVAYYTRISAVSSAHPPNKPNNAGLKVKPRRSFSPPAVGLYHTVRPGGAFQGWTSSMHP